jgi:hypothetical protein
MYEQHYHEEKRQQYAIFAELYIMAEKFADYDSKSVINESLLKLFRDSTLLPGIEMVKAIYDGTQGPCGLRRLLVDLYADAGHPNWISKPGLDVPKAFLHDLTLALLERGPLPQPKGYRVCDRNIIRKRGQAKTNKQLVESLDMTPGRLHSADGGGGKGPDFQWSGSRMEIYELGLTLRLETDK